ncbi:MAG: ribosome maturation factor RimM [Cyclobacteriaceae bacterium]|nr:ribosome maturation factor RimM [Cyclobacteriaceae bacterium]
MTLDDCFKIGYVSKTHGLKGEVTVMLEPDSPDPVEGTAVFLHQGHQLIPYFLTAVSIRHDRAFMRFEEVTTLEGAHALRGASLYLPKTEREPSARGEFYDDEVIGYEMVDETAGAIGTVVSVVSAGPTRLLVAHYQGKEILVPAQKPFIKSVNKTRKVLTLQLPDGFLEI